MASVMKWEENSMGRVMVYIIRRAVSGERFTTRMATREAIQNILGGGFVPDEGSATEIDESLLGREHPGMTDTDFEPPDRSNA
jgi:hypothetical protein